MGGGCGSGFSESDFPFREIGPVAIADVIMRAKESGNMENGDIVENGVV